jgi:arsenite methyltransferase
MTTTSTTSPSGAVPSVSTPVDPEALRASVRTKYRHLALEPTDTFHFHTGRPLAELLAYEPELLSRLPEEAVVAFAGVANPFSMRPLGQDDRVVDVGSGGGFDAFVAAHLVGPSGRVVGVDMTTEMLARAQETAARLGFEHVEFRRGIAEELPVDDGWADVVISNGVLNLVAEKPRVFAEIHRVLRPGGRLQFADIAVGREVPAEAACDIDLWTDCIAGGRSTAAWEQLLRDAGFVDIETGPPVDTFGGAPGEANARAFDVAGHPFFARKPG